MMRDMTTSLSRSWGFFLRHIFYHQARAAALVYYTLFCLVPLIILSLVIARGFFLEKEIELFLIQSFALEEKVFSLLLALSLRAIAGAKGLIFIAIAVMFYLWSAFSLTGRLERHLNKLLRFPEERGLLHRLYSYPLILLFFPLASLMLNAFALYLISEITPYAGTNSLLSEIDDYLIALLHMVPPFLTAALLAIAYYVLPNGKVDWKSSAFAGLFSAVIYQFFQWGYFYFQLRAIHYNPIWGGFAIFPLFLLWLNINWLIFLLGGEVLAIFHQRSSADKKSNLLIK